MPKLHAAQTQAGIVPFWHSKILQLFLSYQVQDICVHNVNTSPIVKLMNSLKKNKPHTDEHPLSLLSKLGTKWDTEADPLPIQLLQGSLLTAIAHFLPSWAGRNRTGSFPGLPPPSSYYNYFPCQPLCQQKVAKDGLSRLMTVPRHQDRSVSWSKSEDEGQSAPHIPLPLG